ncbi:hypothetical protein RP20_CCG013672 [Aedes albopictus]|nr:hypothetical protein RP20_CCG013672 [Aedes albopictus]
MLRFLSRRKTRNVPGTDTADSQIKSQRIPTNKNLVPCRVILLDNTDLSVDLSILDRPGIEPVTLSMVMLNTRAFTASAI